MPDVKPTPPINPFKKTQASTRKAILVSTIAIVLAITTGIIAWFAWVEAHSITKNINAYADKVQQRANKQTQTFEANVTSLQKQVGGLQDKVAQLANLSLQSQSQRSLSEVVYLLHLANLHLIVTQNAGSALSLLEAAKTQLKKIPSPAVSSLEQAVTKNIVELKNVPQFDMPTLLTQLQKLKESIANLPALPDQKMTSPDNTHSDTDSTKSLPWYKKMGHSLLGLKALIIIRHDKKSIKPLLSPEQLIFLKENVQLKIAEAEWGILHRNSRVYQQALTNAKQMLERFYPNQQAMADILNEIDALLKENIAPKLPDLFDTLKILHTISLHSNSKVKPKTSTDSDTPSDQPDDKSGAEQ